MTVDSQSLIRDGRPWIPAMGEFHFSRYPAAEWREELLKMKAGGIDLVATCLFWNQHESERGVPRFDGDLGLRRFVELCAEPDLALVVRLGPWSHGECRNGGHPDWLSQADCTPRSDDPACLTLVEPYYRRIAEELRGLFPDDGGPITALQVDNGLYGNPGHLATLRRMAGERGPAGVRGDVPRGRRRIGPRCRWRSSGAPCRAGTRRQYPSAPFPAGKLSDTQLHSRNVREGHFSVNSLSLLPVIAPLLDSSFILRRIVCWGASR
ncbi:beta-galactosidase [Streptomyces sp. NPDC052309]|uniref:beta-galactosidase n=1 Tax=Streptomyces sp. NPDC052309 TaxID=3155421 RepID=UPI003418EB80